MLVALQRPCQPAAYLRRLVVTTATTRTRCFSSSTPTSATPNKKFIDLRSDTVTSPSRPMLEAALTAPTGDDVFGEDPSINGLEAEMANMFGKEAGLFVPTGTMSNLVAILAHCHGRASEIIIGTQSHINLWEGGGAAGLGGVHTRQIPEDIDTAELNVDDVRDAWRLGDDDDHCAKTELLCLENTHNMMGGVALSVEYMDRMGALCHNDNDNGGLNIGLHVDGARIFNAAVALNVSVQRLCAAADSVSICLSKGLGAPAGSVLVGDSETIRLAKRARKRCGGGMRQAGVLAAMGSFALQHNVQKLADDHARAQRLAETLSTQGGFRLLRDGKVDTNIVYFRLPDNANINVAEYQRKLKEERGVLLSGGYSRGRNLFRVVTHLDLTDEEVNYAAKAMIEAAGSQ